LLDRIEHLEKLCDKKEKFLQSTKMILKFRETHIGNLEKARQMEGPTDPSQAAVLVSVSSITCPPPAVVGDSVVLIIGSPNISYWNIS